MSKHIESLSYTANDKFAICDLVIDDLDRIVEIERSCMPAPWGATMLSTEFENGIARFHGATVCGVLVAFCLTHLILDELHILIVAVLPEYRQRNIAFLLLSAVLDYGRTNGAVSSFLEMRISNIPARKLYEKLQYRVVYIRKGYYGDTGEDAVVMECGL